MSKRIVKNNLIALSVHVGICLVLILPIGIIFFYGVWHDSIWGWWPLRDIVSQWLYVGVTTMAALILYFWAGRKYLVNTHKPTTNVLSVAVLPGVIMLAGFVALSNPGRIGMLGLLATPIYPVSETLSYFLPIGRIHGYMIMSVLPPLAMWLGLATKRREPKMPSSEFPVSQ